MTDSRDRDGDSEPEGSFGFGSADGDGDGESADMPTDMLADIHMQRMEQAEADFNEELSGGGGYGPDSADGRVGTRGGYNVRSGEDNWDYVPQPPQGRRHGGRGGRGGGGAGDSEEEEEQNVIITEPTSARAPSGGENDEWD